MTAPVDPGAADQPLLRVVNADASPEEIAALVAVFSSMRVPHATAPQPPRVWNAPSRLVRQTLQAGPAGWRASGLPTR